ncbi:hypothetical protein A2U01_0116060, partial [Trifolium medium]|nr:hypothetical protein [Trifolium medium]
ELGQGLARARELGKLVREENMRKLEDRRKLR